MQRRWPGFELAYRDENRAHWFGSLAGLEMPYRVSIQFGLPILSVPLPLWRRFPEVRVLSPKLKLVEDAAEEAPLPHVFFEDPDITLSPLCLFDPDANEWSHNELIAATTVPWTADWLACYEAWLATGKWLGGGRHAVAQAGTADLERSQ